MQGGRPPKRPAEGHSPAAELPDIDDLAAFTAAATPRVAAREVPARVAAGALRGMPSLAPLFAGNKQSTFVVHAHNPHLRCKPSLFKRKIEDEKVEAFPAGNGDIRALSADYQPTNMLLAFFCGKDAGTMWDSLKSVGGIGDLERTTKPSMHMALLGGLLHLLEAGDIYRRWLFYIPPKDWKQAFFTVPKAENLPPPGMLKSASPAENVLNVRKTLWAWAFNGEELPSEEAMQALGGPVKAEEMYELARKLWGLPEAAGR